MVFDVLGPNVLALIKRCEFRGVPVESVRKVAAHTLAGLDYLHRFCGVIHGLEARKRAGDVSLARAHRQAGIPARGRALDAGDGARRPRAPGATEAPEGDASDGPGLEPTVREEHNAAV